MGRGKRSLRSAKALDVVTLSDSRSRLVPGELAERFLRDAHDLPEAGARVELVRAKGASGGVRRGERGTVLGLRGRALRVVWDSGKETVLRVGLDQYAVVTVVEIEERRRWLEKRRIQPESRVAVLRLRSPKAKQELKRLWRGTVTRVTGEGLVEVAFDEGPRLLVDPLLDELEDVTGEELAKGRDLAIARLGLKSGVRVELTADIPGEKLLRAGLKGTVSHVQSSRSVVVDWDDENVGHNLLPEVDGPYIKVLPAPE